MALFSKLALANESEEQIKAKINFRSLFCNFSPYNPEFSLVMNNCLLQIFSLFFLINIH